MNKVAIKRKIRKIRRTKRKFERCAYILAECLFNKYCEWAPYILLIGLLLWVLIGSMGVALDCPYGISSGSYR